MSWERSIVWRGIFFLMHLLLLSIMINGISWNLSGIAFYNILFYYLYNGHLQKAYIYKDGWVAFSIEVTKFLFLGLCFYRMCLRVIWHKPNVKYNRQLHLKRWWTFILRKNKELFILKLYKLELTQNTHFLRIYSIFRNEI